jgi:hypothetical protein
VLTFGGPTSLRRPGFLPRFVLPGAVRLRSFKLAEAGKLRTKTGAGFLNVPR